MYVFNWGTLCACLPACTGVHKSGCHQQKLGRNLFFFITGSTKKVKCLKQFLKIFYVIVCTYVSKEPKGNFYIFLIYFFAIRENLTIWKQIKRALFIYRA